MSSGDNLCYFFSGNRHSLIFCSLSYRFDAEIKLLTKRANVGVQFTIIDKIE